MMAFLGWVFVLVIAIFAPRTMFALAVGILAGWSWLIIVPLTIGGIIIDIIASG